jgi:type 1 glutamine amidotransferase
VFLNILAGVAMSFRRSTVFGAVLLSLFCSSTICDAHENARKKIVLIAGPKSHGPVGNGIHDYPWSVKLLKVMLDNSNVNKLLDVEFHLEGFPDDLKTLDNADTIMVISDGRDGDKYVPAPHFASEKNREAVQKQIDRGCGFLTFHFSTFAADKFSKQILDWSGGYFDWETNGERKWFSAIQTKDANVSLPNSDHPVVRGVKPFKMRDEFYYNIRFSSESQTPIAFTPATPIFAVSELPGREPDGKVVAWAKTRKNGGRGFGTTCGHFYDNWKHDDFRQTILNAIAWTARIEVPKAGVRSKFYSHTEITAALAASENSKTSASRSFRGIIFAGNEAHKWHNWEKTTPAIKSLLERDSRIKVDVSLDIEDLCKKDMGRYAFIVQNYVNWHDKKTLSDASRKALVRFLENGGGLILVHFANGAYHFSLPMAGESDWPEYRKISRRQWNHFGKGENKSGHDAFGKFTVNVTDLGSPITTGLKNFEVTDELYYQQNGGRVDALITATSKNLNKSFPLAYTYRYGKGRIFQTLLGHSEKTYDTFEAREMIRRAAAWVSRQAVVPLTLKDDSKPVSSLK